MSSSDGYAFGDSDLAAARMRLVAEVFDPPSRAFLAAAGPPSAPAVALDLGCGPGCSTQLLAEVIAPQRLIGVDLSPGFAAMAEAASIPRAEFVVHDVTAMPLPAAPVDFIYARLLLAHLPQPAEVAARWCSQLTPGGVLALDEIEWMHTDHPVLARYEEVVVALVAAHGGLMYAGPGLGQIVGVGDVSIATNAVVEYLVPVPVAARMYAMNMEVWRSDSFVRERYGDAYLDELGAALADTAAGQSADAVSWGLRQLSLRRARPEHGSPG